MFTLFEPGGMRIPYVPGSFRQRNVEKISKASPSRQVKVGQEDPPSVSQKNAGPSSLPARLYEQVDSLTQSSRAKILARDIMSSPVVTLPVTSSLAQAWSVVHSRRFRHIPILGAEGVVVGMLSDRDLFRGTIESVLPGTVESHTPAGGSIQGLVSRPVLVASPEAELCALARVLLEEHIGALPIVSESVGLVGMITRSDILRALVAHPDFDQWV
ncbi:CBS domain-containing protein [Candidatus Nitrospira allomarina]|uniref:CBS domain-containing protein n=1 Tax=Candidatus Nitrospira allomarina TaxID=3020900 RepID=A0AA96GDU9_9BACT|nr:CBS domain-containing protein [Candidatus Nitrospira allomarina]WNM59993.1 CBS domain-containing protein [Candidatus Nitrospira allomarina]